MDYRRNKGNGTWVIDASDGHGKRWTKGFAQADDFDESNGDTILTYFEAIDVAKKLARGGGESDPTAPVTVDRALTDYGRDLLSRGANLYNSKQPRGHLTAVLLSKPVALLTSRELNTWKLGLLDKIKPASINRICSSIRAALELAAQHDPRTKNRDAWEVGLAGLPNAGTARNVVLSDERVHALVAAAYRHDPALGLLTDTLATSGTRPVQAARLRCEDLHDHPQKPKLMMSKSGKGGGKNRSERKREKYSLPITLALAAKLKQAAAGRPADAPLLLQADGTSWGEDPGQKYTHDIRKCVEAIGEDGTVVTMYCLRHSSICRMLLRNIPIRLVASLHDTSVDQIEKKLQPLHH
jgi:hypothetical protein